ncbi:hypothetical protein [Candidatus Ichthyocystis sparus]|uniref:hypothetical protein n=1 Tax=Candidatus Ichthyocystis sparus TaxID=1561004 RepID=UPI0011475DDD|nr:hypothetical protein [Candidatus Ichthyocystis sparus]
MVDSFENALSRQELPDSVPLNGDSIAEITFRRESEGKTHKSDKLQLNLQLLLPRNPALTPP